MVDITFIIVNWNTKDLLLVCLNSVFNTVRHFSFEVYVVDNGSVDGSPEEVKNLFGDRVKLIKNCKNFGFAKANNQAIKLAAGKYIFLLNSDAELKKGTVTILIEFLENHPAAAMAGPKMIGTDGRLQNSFDNFPSLLTELVNKSLLRKLFPAKFSGKSQKLNSSAFEVDSLIGACIAVRKKAVDAIGVFDEDYFFFMEETDWCMRMRKRGWKIFHVPTSSVIHRQGQSKNKAPASAWIEYYRSLYLFFRKNRSKLSYMLLRIFRFLKLTINLFLNIIALVATLGFRKRYREKTLIYYRLFLWHIMFCPESEGLK